MDVRKMSSKWSSASSYLIDTKPVWIPHGRPKDILKVIVYQFLYECHKTYLNTPWTSKRCPQSDRLPVPIWLTQHLLEHPVGRPKDVLKVIVYEFLFVCHKTYLNTPWTPKRCHQCDRLPVLIWVTQHLLEHPMNIQNMSSKWSYTSSYLTDTTSAWTPHGRPSDVLKGILYKFLFECPNPIWTPHGRAKDVLKVIVYQFLFDWHNTCLNTTWTSKWCPQNGRLPVPIWLTQNQFEHPVDVQMMSSKGSSSSSYLGVPTLFEHHMDVQKMSSKWSSTSSHLTATTPAWKPHGRPKDVLKGIFYQFLFEWHNQFEHPMDVQKMSSKWSSASSYMTDTTPAWTPRWASKRCPQIDRLRVPICVSQNLFEHPMDAQKMSSMWSSTSSYLSDTTPAWTPHEHPKDILKVIVYQFLFDWHNICLNTLWTSKWCPQRDPLQVPIWVSQPYLNTPWTCKRCPQSDRLPVPIWLTQHLLEHPMNVQMMSSKWSSTCSYLTNTKPVWTPRGRPNDVLKGILYKFIFGCHKTYLNTPWTYKRCPQSDRLPVPIWLRQHLLENPMDVQKMSSKWSSASSYMTDTTPAWTSRWASKRCPQIDRLRVPICVSQNLFEHPMDAQKMSSMWSSTSSYLSDTTPAWTPHEHPKDVLKVIVYQFLFDWHNICLNTLWTSKWCPQRDPLQVPIWVSQPYLNTPWTCKRCPQSDRLPVPIWLTQHLLEHPMNVQMMSSKWSSTCSYLTNTKPVWTPRGRPNDVLKGILYKFIFGCPNPIWTPHGRAKDVLKVIVYQCPFDCENTCLKTPWTSKRCPQSDRLPVPI